MGSRWLAPPRSIPFFKSFECLSYCRACVLCPPIITQATFTNPQSSSSNPLASPHKHTGSLPQTKQGSHQPHHQQQNVEQGYSAAAIPHASSSYWGRLLFMYVGYYADQPLTLEVQPLTHAPLHSPSLLYYSAVARASLLAPDCRGQCQAGGAATGGPRCGYVMV